MGITVGLVVLFVFHRALRESNYVTLPNVQILIGLLMLFFALIVVIPGRLRLRPTRVTGPAERLLRGPSLVVAGVAGLGIALPSVDYLAALAVMLTADADAATQVALLLAFNVVAFALVEIPLLGYLLAPRATLRWVASLHGWIRARRRVEVASVLTAIGCGFLAVGVAGL
jgi:Sap-like sulfolipid-1-addressing protein